MRLLFIVLLFSCIFGYNLYLESGGRKTIHFANRYIHKYTLISDNSVDVYFFKNNEIIYNCNNTTTCQFGDINIDNADYKIIITSNENINFLIYDYSENFTREPEINFSNIQLDRITHGRIKFKNFAIILGIALTIILAFVYLN